MSNTYNNPSEFDKIPPKQIDSVKDVYFCVYFDGTANNCYKDCHPDPDLLQKSEKVNRSVMNMFSKPMNIFSRPNLICNIETQQTEYDLGINIFSRPNYPNETQLYPSETQQVEYDLEIGQYKGEVNETDKTIRTNEDWKYSNIAILRSLTKRKKDYYKYKTYNLYIEGVGTLWDGGSDWLTVGEGTGNSGVPFLVSKAIKYIINYLKSSSIPVSANLHFAIFGFSRGSTCGRLLAYILSDHYDELGDAAKKEMQKWLKHFGIKNVISELKKYTGKTIDFLGLYDTVSSIGYLKYQDSHKAAKNAGLSDITNKVMFASNSHNVFHHENVTDFGLFSPKKEKVKSTFQICAIDECRANFALVDLGVTLKNNCIEVFIPGCHSDIGGGYMDSDDEKEHVIRLHRKIEGYATTMNQSFDPREIMPTKDLSKDVLSEIGWLNKPKEGKSEKEIKKEQISPSQSCNSIAYDNKDFLIFKRFAKQGYSNIPLHMMVYMAQRKLKENNWPEPVLPFNLKHTPPRFKIKEDEWSDIIKGILGKSDIKEYIDGLQNNERTWQIPNDNLYKKLRSGYLHFTCTDKIDKLEDLGNAPYWKNVQRTSSNGTTDEVYMLSRIVYHGDQNNKTMYDFTSAFTDLFCCVGDQNDKNMHDFTDYE